MSLLAIVQFEVHFFQDGRWMLQSRFPADQRVEAIRDAVSVESSTKRPTKVIKETFFPQENRGETVTVYIGPMLKAAMDKGKPIQAPALYSARQSPAAKPAAKAHHQVRATPRKIAPQAADLFWRSVIAMGMSLTAATIVTAMVSWLLTHLPDFGLVIDAGKTSAILTLTYAVVFLFGVASLFRFGTPIKRLIWALWQSAKTETTQDILRTKLPLASLRLKPKRGSQAALQREQDLAELKLRRGDIDPLVPEGAEVAEQTQFDVPVIYEQLTAEKPTAPGSDQAPQPVAQPPPEQIALPNTMDVVAPKTLQESASVEAAFEAGQPTAKSVPEPAARLVPPTTTFNPAISELQRSMALRFVAEVILPQVAREHDDPVGRRGAALFLTGAMAHLASVSNLSPLLAMSMISSSVMAALPRHAVDAFLNQYDAHISLATNAQMIEDGRHTMARFLAGQKNDTALAQSLHAWRVRLPSTADQRAAASSQSEAAPTDYYLLTEFRHGNAFMMDFHNHVVRQAVEAADGREIKHTGRGILARFEYADFAVQAAMAISAKINTSPGVPNTVLFGVALMGGFGAADDPLLSSSITKSAQSVLESAPRGVVICEPRVFANTHAKSSLNSQPFNATWLTLSEKSGPSLVESAA